MTAYRSFIHDDDKKVLIIGRQETDMGTINSAMPIYNDGIEGYQYVGSTASVNNEPHIVSPSDGSTSDLLLGVTSFNQYNDNTSFQRVNFSQDLVADNTDPSISVTNGLLSNSHNDYPALDFGSKGAVFFGRWSCGANLSSNGDLGASILPNSVSDGRLQFCRNLLSSIAPDNTLVDVEVGTLSVPGETAGASYELISDHANEFSIIGEKLILNGGADLSAGTYDLVFNVTTVEGNEIVRTLSLDVNSGNAEKRHVATRDTYHVGETVSFSTENLVTDTAYLIQATENLEDSISWVSIDSALGGGLPSNTGVITLHYRINENGSTYDRFHEIEIVHDCSSDHCASFATSMDTANDLAFGKDFDASHKSTWDSFFQRFSTGTGSFANSRSVQEGSLTGNYEHDLSVNFGTRSASLNTDGAVNSVPIDETWNFAFEASGGPCNADLCTLDNASTAYDLTVNLMNVALPNGKHSMMIRTELAEGSDSFTADYEPMTPQ